MANRVSCVFYASWFDAIEVLPEAVQSEAYRAILSFALRGVETEKQGAMTKLIMAMVRPQIEANNKRYENGCKGGRPKGENNQTITKPKPNNNQTITKPKPNDNVNVNDDVNDNVFSLSFVEREKIFEIFHFERNIANANKEAERFINHYEASDWCRANSDKPVRNKVALAKSWKVEREERQYPENVCKWLHAVYRNAQANNYDAGRLFQIERVTTENNTVIVYCRREVAEVIEANKVPRDFALTYKVRRE